MAGGFSESDNGNGSLMRILPLLFYLRNHPLEERLRLIREVSSMTHVHLRLVFSCFICLEFAGQLVAGAEKCQTYANTINPVNLFIEDKPFNQYEIQ